MDVSWQALAFSAVVISMALIAAKMCALVFHDLRGSVEYDELKGMLEDTNNNLNGPTVFEGEYDSRGYYKFGKITRAGETYVGGFDEHAQFSGPGVYTFRTPGVKYVGEFVDGKFDGHGTETYANGSKYVGHFASGKRHGFGVMTYRGSTELAKPLTDATISITKTAPSETNSASDVSDELHISASCCTTETEATTEIMPSPKVSSQRHLTSYSGNWKAGVKNGHGTIYFSDGSKLDAKFENGLKHGTARFTTSDGAVKKLKYKNGSLVKRLKRTSRANDSETQAQRAI